MPTFTARTMKGSRRLARRIDRRSPSPKWHFLRGFLKNPVMVGSVIPSSRVLIDRMLGPVQDVRKPLMNAGPMAKDTAGPRPAAALARATQN